MAQTINVNTNPESFPATLYFSQGDIGREFDIILASSDGYAVPAGATVTMVATKPSGFGFTVAGTLTNNVASFVTTETMTNEAGRFPAEIRIEYNGDVIGTANFYLDGEPDPHPADTIDGDAETIIPELTVLVERVESAASSVLDMQVVATTLPAGSDATYTYDEDTNTATFGIPKGADGTLSSGVLAPTYSTSATYAVGDYVYYSGSLYRCTTAITTAESWTSGHWTQVALASDVTDLKDDINDIQEAAEYAYTLNGMIRFSDGKLGTASGYKATDFIWCGEKASIAIYDFWIGSSGCAYAFYKDDKTYISGANSIHGDYLGNITIPSNAKYVRFSSLVDDGYGSTFDPKAVVYSLNESQYDYEFEKLNETYKYPYTTGKFINTSGAEATSAQYAITDYIICDSASYIKIEDIWTGSSSLAYAFYTKDKVFISGVNSTTGDVIVSSIPSNAKYIRASSLVDDGYGSTFNPSITIYNNIALNKKVDSIYKTVSSMDTLKELNILVFGDSITDTANITIDGDTDTTTAYSIKNPNNSYVKDGVTINYAMWPTLIGRVLDIKELRNYALAGAHFYTPSSTPPDPRLVLKYQIEVALNDLLNPNNVFPYDDFSPDIVIVACGINDGAVSSGAYESAMAKTVMNPYGTGIDVEATLANLNQESVLEAMRYALMVLKQNFPTALMLYVNPLQQTYGTEDARQIARAELGKMAERYDFINLDGFAQFGIVRDFETQEQIGMMTKDGLHPNEKGQNLYARNIVQAIKRYYFPLDKFN